MHAEEGELHDFLHECRRAQLSRVGPHDPGSPLRVLGELDVIRAYARMLSCCMNIVETLAGGKMPRDMV